MCNHDRCMSLTCVHNHVTGTDSGPPTDVDNLIMLSHSVQCSLYKKWCDQAMGKIVKGNSKRVDLMRKVNFLALSLHMLLNNIIMNESVDLKVRVRFETRSLFLHRVSDTVF